MSVVDLKSGRRASKLPVEIRRYSAFFEQSSLPMEIFAMNGDCIAVNRAWIEVFAALETDYSRYNLFQDQQLVEIGMIPYLRRAYKGEALSVPPVYYDPSASGKEGRARWLECHLFPIRNEKNRVCALAMILVDVSEKKMAEMMNLQAIRVRDEFISIAAHEIKTPLCPMKLQIEVLLKMFQTGEPLDRDRIYRILQAVHRQTQVMTSLIDNFLDVSRLNTGSLELKIEFVPVLKLIMDVCDRYALHSVFTIFSSECHQKLIGAWDRLRIEQVLVNLLSNAVKYAPGSPIRVEVRIVKDEIIIAVVDQGPGISKENISRIFERYARADENNMATGLGLGLYIAKQIVEAHHGALWAESEVGKGSTFYVKLPLFIPEV